MNLVFVILKETLLYSEKQYYTECDAYVFLEIKVPLLYALRERIS